MAKNIFNAEKTYYCRLHGVTFSNFPEQVEPRVPGKLAADTEEVTDPVFGKEEYAVFTVGEPNGAFPPQWVGTYRLPMDAKNRWYGEEKNEV